MYYKRLKIILIIILVSLCIYAEDNIELVNLYKTYEEKIEELINVRKNFFNLMIMNNEEKKKLDNWKDTTIKTKDLFFQLQDECSQISLLWDEKYKQAADVEYNKKKQELDKILIEIKKNLFAVQ